MGGTPPNVDGTYGIAARLWRVALTVPAGAQLGRYEIVKHLASGLMAELLLARARGLEGFERHFVIKRIRTEQERDEAFVEMFLAEARLAAALHHHNIVQVHDIGEDDGKPYFAMEYVHGEDLRCVLARLFERCEHVPLEHVISIVCSVAGALHHAHEALGPDRQPLGIVHRDVTPSNILLGYDGNVKVVDFGIARAAMRRTETQAGMLVGKAPYMAPEQCVGGAIDRRSDVFALGIVLFELITGRRLFKGENEFLTMSAVVEANVPPPSAHRSDVSPALDKIVLKALSRDPAQRYQTAEQMFFALDTLASQEGLRSSGLALAAFMKDLFGHRVEPWLGGDERPHSTSPDFDGAYPGLAAPPTGAFETYADASTKKASPITRARTHAISEQPATHPIAATTGRVVARTAPAGVPVVVGEARSAAVRIPEGPVAPAGRPRDKAVLRTTQVPVAPMPTRKRPKTKTVQIPVTKSAEATVEALEATRVDPADSLEIPVEAPPPRPAPVVGTPAAPTGVKPVARSGLSVTAFSQKPGAAPTKLPSLKDGAAAAMAATSTTPPTRRNTPPPLPVAGDKRKTPPPMPALEAPVVLAESSQTMPPVVESSQGMPQVIEPAQAMSPVIESAQAPPIAVAPTARATTVPASASEQALALASVKASSRSLPLPDVHEADPETEIDPLASRQGEVAAKSPSIWNNPETFEPDEPSVVLRSKSLILAALAEDAARTDAEDARADAEEARVAAERSRADSEIEPPTRVDDVQTRASEFADHTEIDDGPTRVSPDERARRALDDSITEFGSPSVMPDLAEVSTPSNRGPTLRPSGPPERGSQDRITPLPPPPMMPEITDYPRLPRSDRASSAPATALPGQGWMPAAPTVDATPMSSRKKLLIAVGVGAAALIAIVAFALGGGDDTPPREPDSIAKPIPREPPTPTEPEHSIGSGASEPTGTPPTTTEPDPPPKTTPRPPTKPTKVTPKIATKPPAKKPPAKKPPAKKPPVKKPPVKKPPPKKPEGWDPNSLFPKKK